MTFEEWWRQEGIRTFRTDEITDSEDMMEMARKLFEAGVSEYKRKLGEVGKALLEAQRELEALRRMPGSWMRIIQQVLDRVLAGEAAEQVVADYRDEYGHTIEGLERVEGLRRDLEALQAEVRGLAKEGHLLDLNPEFDTEHPAMARALREEET